MQPTLFDEERPRATPAASAMPPVNGNSTMSRHASATGALAAWKDRSPNIKRLRELWQVPRTMHEVVALTGLSLSSVCSLKSAIESELVPVGFEPVHRLNSKSTKRTLWQLRTHVQEKE